MKGEYMKLFLDTADVGVVRKWVSTGLIDGVTTNPSHLAHIKKDPMAQVHEICALLPNGEVSVEVTETEPEKIYAQAKKIAALSDNILVKIPCHADYYHLMQRLVQEDIKINVTLVFTLIQSIFMCKLGVAYISPFIGRWDDIDVEGKDVLFEIRAMIDTYNFKTKLLAASIRGVRHMHEAIVAGADAVTVPVDVLEKASKHSLTQEGIEKFNADWAKLGIKQFP